MNRLARDLPPDLWVVVSCQAGCWSWSVTSGLACMSGPARDHEMAWACALSALRGTLKLRAMRAGR